MPRAPTVRISVGFGSDSWTQHCTPPRPTASSSSQPPPPPSPPPRAPRTGPPSQACIETELREAFATIAKLKRKVASLRRERDEAQQAARAKAAHAGVDRASLRRSIKRALRKTHPDKREPITNAEMTVLLNDLLEHVPS